MFINSIPPHVSIELNKHNDELKKTAPTESVKDDNFKKKFFEKNIFVQKAINELSDVEPELKEFQKEILFSILQNPNIDPRNVNANIQLAREYTYVK